jgi:transposase
MGSRPCRVPSGRKRGGQPGHPGQRRALVPIEEVAAVVPVKPRQCHRCHHPLYGEDAQPHRHLVTELPPVQPIVTE